MNTNRLEGQLDDLTVIKGIKKTRQAWLREHMQVNSYKDLAALSVADIEATFKANRRFVARNLIEEWLETAEKLAAQTEQTTVTPQPEEPRLAEWQPFASFVVEFQERKLAGQGKEQRTTVHYMERDEGTTWSGLAHADLSAWIKQQVGDTLPMTVAEPATFAEKPRAPARKPVEVTIQRLVAKQPLALAKSPVVYEMERPFNGFLQANCPFSAKIDLLLSHFSEPLPTIDVELHARNMTSGVNVPLPFRLLPAEAGSAIATAVLDNGTLPAGFYRFGFLFKQAEPRHIQFVELPQLQVV